MKKRIELLIKRVLSVGIINKVLEIVKETKLVVKLVISYINKKLRIIRLNKKGWKTLDVLKINVLSILMLYKESIRVIRKKIKEVKKKKNIFDWVKVKEDIRYWLKEKKCVIELCYKMMNIKNNKIYKVTRNALRLLIYLIVVIYCFEYFVIFLEWFTMRFGGKLSDIYSFDVRDSVRGANLGTEEIIGDSELGYVHSGKTMLIKLGISYFVKVSYIAIVNWVPGLIGIYLLIIYCFMFGWNIYISSTVFVLLSISWVTMYMHDDYNLLGVLTMNGLLLLSNLGIDRGLLEELFSGREVGPTEEEFEIEEDEDDVFGFDVSTELPLEYDKKERYLLRKGKKENIYWHLDDESIENRIKGYSGTELERVEEFLWRDAYNEYWEDIYDMYIDGKPIISRIYDELAYYLNGKNWKRLENWYVMRNYESFTLGKEYNEEYYEENFEWMSDLEKLGYDEEEDEGTDWFFIDMFHHPSMDEWLAFDQLARKYRITQEGAILDWHARSNVTEGEYLTYHYLSNKESEVLKEISKYNVFLYDMLENKELLKKNELKNYEENYLGFFKDVLKHNVSIYERLIKKGYNLTDVFKDKGFNKKIMEVIIKNGMTSTQFGALYGNSDKRLTWNIRKILYKVNNDLNNVYTGRSLINKISYGDLRDYEDYLWELRRYYNGDYLMSGVHWDKFMDEGDLAEENETGSLIGVRKDRELYYGGGERMRVGGDLISLGSEVYDSKSLLRNLKGYSGLDYRKVKYPLVSRRDVRWFDEGLVNGKSLSKSLKLLVDVIKKNTIKYNYKELSTYNYISKLLYARGNLVSYVNNLGLWSLSDDYLKSFISVFLLKEVYNLRDNDIVYQVVGGNDFIKIMKDFEVALYEFMGLSTLHYYSPYFELIKDKSYINFKAKLGEHFYDDVHDEDEDYIELPLIDEQIKEFERGESGIVFEIMESERKDKKSLKFYKRMLKSIEPMHDRGCYDLVDVLDVDVDDFGDYMRRRRYASKMSKVVKPGNSIFAWYRTMLGGSYGESWVDTLWQSNYMKDSTKVEKELMFPGRKGGLFGWTYGSTFMTRLYDYYVVNYDRYTYTYNIFRPIIGYSNREMLHRAFGSVKRRIVYINEPLGGSWDVSRSEDVSGYLLDRVYDTLGVFGSIKSGEKRMCSLDTKDLLNKTIVVTRELEKNDPYYINILKKRIFYNIESMPGMEDEDMLDDEYFQDEYMEGIVDDLIMKKDKTGYSYSEIITPEFNKIKEAKRRDYANYLEYSVIDILRKKEFEVEKVRESLTDCGLNSMFDDYEYDLFEGDYVFTEVENTRVPLDRSIFVTLREGEGVVRQKPKTYYAWRNKFLRDNDLNLLRKMYRKILEGSYLDIIGKKERLREKAWCYFGDKPARLKKPYNQAGLKFITTRHLVLERDEKLVEGFDELDYIEDVLREGSRKERAELKTRVDLLKILNNNNEAYFGRDWRYSGFIVGMEYNDLFSEEATVDDVNDMKEYSLERLLSNIGSYEEFMRLWLVESMYKREKKLSMKSMLETYLNLRGNFKEEKIVRDGRSMIRLDNYFKRKETFWKYKDISENKIYWNIKKIYEKAIKLQNEMSVVSLERSNKEGKEKMLTLLYLEDIFGEDVVSDQGKLRKKLSRVNDYVYQKLKEDYRNKIKEVWSTGDACGELSAELSMEILLGLKEELKEIRKEKEIKEYYYNSLRGEFIKKTSKIKIKNEEEFKKKVKKIKRSEEYLRYCNE